MVGGHEVGRQLGTTRCAGGRWRHVTAGRLSRLYLCNPLMSPRGTWGRRGCVTLGRLPRPYLCKLLVSPRGTWGRRGCVTLGRRCSSLARLKGLAGGDGPSWGSSWSDHCNGSW